MRVAVVSSCYGGYDVIQPPTPQDVPADWVLVTEWPGEFRPFRMVLEGRPQLHPRLAAKVAKCRPDLYADGADVTVWIDASIRLRNHGFLSWCLEHLGQADIALIRHPDRTTISAEADASIRLLKYLELPVLEQVGHYLRQGHPDGWGLWAAGVIVRRSSPAVAAFGDAWLAEQVRWTYQDQLSLPHLLRTSGLKVADLPLPSLLNNHLFHIGPHASER